MESFNVTLSEDQTIEATIYQLQEEVVAFRKIDQIATTPMNAEMRANYQSLEFCKVSNRVEVKYGCNSDEVAMHVKHYNLA